ncbi:hypothetical protein KNT87_gp143 [Erwinia phage Cronus]|uniref:Uncharacterized protein n=1 Tax=Erwinia phage Cronus TaxID=2163633 RepID=A0A2S1GM15_9CAUD|nr:hypothetical protein KNT87_gp143 [Erwinia phage Cronus]AWD90426.1 hypothetical protein [Erwinia phage Cronus]
MKQHLYLINYTRDGRKSSYQIPATSEANALVRLGQIQTDTYRQIENDVWIEWDGGVMPVHEDTLLEVRFSDGGEDGPDPAYSWHWNHMGHSRDVFAYRLIENVDRRDDIEIDVIDIKKTGLV